MTPSNDDLNTAEMLGMFTAFALQGLIASGSLNGSPEARVLLATRAVEIANTTLAIMVEKGNGG